MNNIISNLFYILVLLSGFFTIAITLLGTIKSKIKIYWYLLVFYSLFSFKILATFIRNFLSFTTEISKETIFDFKVLDVLISTLFMISITLFFQNIFIKKERKKHMVLVLILYIISFALYFFPNSYNVLSNGNIVLGYPSLISSFLFSLLFIYMIIISLIGDKKDKPIRELVLIWYLIIFGAVGLLETVLSLYSILENREMIIEINQNDFILSSIPYFLSSGVLAYYFGSYLLVFKKTQVNQEIEVLKKYGLTPREQDLIPLLIKGLNNKEIAEKLYISLSTVKTHIHKIYGKTNVKSRYELFYLLKKE